MADDQKAKLKRLNELELFRGLPAPKLAELAALLKPVSAAKGSVVVEEGSAGDSMFFVVEGRVRIDKRLSGGASKELALLGPGDFFGEMALLEQDRRSAHATAVENVLLFNLEREDLMGWLKTSPETSAAFFMELLKTLSHRLRVTSLEQALLFELAAVFASPPAEPKELAAAVVKRVTHYLEGDWSAGVFLYNPFNEEYDFVAAEGKLAARLAKTAPPAEGGGWVAERLLWTAFPGAKPAPGFLVLESAKGLSARECEDIARIAATVGRLFMPALTNLRHAEEERLKARLKEAAS